MKNKSYDKAKTKNPLNISIQFNINPKKVIKNQINKNISIKHYHNEKQGNMKTKNNNNQKQEIRKKSQSQQLMVQKNNLNQFNIFNLNKSCQYDHINKNKQTNNLRINMNKNNDSQKNNKKYEQYFQNNSIPFQAAFSSTLSNRFVQSLYNKKKRHNSNIIKYENPRKKSVSDFPSHKSQHLDFSLNSNQDESEQFMIQKINKMKKYFLQRIGSMDITIDQNQNQQNNLNTNNNHIDQQHEYQYEQAQSHLLDRQITPKLHYNGIQQNNQINMITQKFSQHQYGYQNLISYQNQRNSQAIFQKKNNNINIDNIQNIHFNKKQIQISQQFSNYKMPQIVLDSFNSMQIKQQYLKHHKNFISQNINLLSSTKSKNLNKQIQKYKNIKNKNRKVQKSLKNNHFTQKKSKLSSKKDDEKILILKQKIDLIDNCLLNNQVSESIISNISLKSLIDNQNDNNLKQSNFSKKYTSTNLDKPNNQLSVQIINQIKSYQNRSKQNKLLDQYSFNKIINEIKKQDPISQNTKNIIQHYINLLSEDLQYEGQIIKIQDSQGLSQNNKNNNNYLDFSMQMKSSNQSQYKIAEKQSSFNSQQQNQKASSIEQSNKSNQQNKNTNSNSKLQYSQQRIKKSQLDKKMKEQYIKRFNINPDHIIQDIQRQGSQIKTSINRQQCKYNQKNIVNELNSNTNLDSILKFIKTNIQQNNNDKEILNNLYNKLSEFYEKEKEQIQSPKPGQKQIKIQSNKTFKKQAKQAVYDTPLKKQKLKKNGHKRYFSSFKISSKQTSQYDSSFKDLSIWDLAIIQQSLNKKYHQLFSEKFSRGYNFQQSNQLRQILKTKKQINKSIDFFNKLFKNEKNQIKMKSMSQKYLKYKIEQNNQIETNQFKKYQESKNYLANKQQIQKIRKNKNKQKIKSNKIAKIQIDLDTFLINQNLVNKNNFSNSLKQTKQHQIISIQNNYGNQDQISQYSSSTPYSEQDEKIFSPDSDNDQERQQFIDLLKIENYQLNNMPVLSQNQQYLKQIVKKNSRINMKNLTQDDKLDICQFILLDLSIQFYQQSLDNQQQLIKKGQYLQGPHKIIKKIFNFIKAEAKKPKIKPPKIGIHTQLNTVKQFIGKISNYVENLHQRNTNDKQSNRLIIQRINSPIGPTALQILKSMRYYEDDCFTNNNRQEPPLQYYESDALNSLILPIYIFTDFEQKLHNEKQFQFDRFFEDQQKQKNRIGFLKNVTHVHHKAIFDCLNQILDFQRPFGIWGKPFPWKKRNIYMKPLNLINLKNSLKSACSKVVQSAMYICGLLVDKQESLVKNTSVSEAYISQVKQDRMSKMIVNDFLQNQARFSFLDDEETQILLETTYIIWVILVQQVVIELGLILDKKTVLSHFENYSSQQQIQ